MDEYIVTVSRVSKVKIKAESRQRANESVKQMKDDEIIKLSEFDRYDVLETAEVEKPVFYYVITLKNRKRIFFRITKKLDTTLDIARYAVDVKNVISCTDECLLAQEVNEEDYREGILNYFSSRINAENKKFLDGLNLCSKEEFIEQVPQIYFYSDMVHVFNDCSCSEDFELDSIEKLLSLEKPLEYLYDEKYCEIDFSNTNEQMIGLFNSAVK